MLKEFLYVNVIPLVKNVYRTALPSKTATCLACQKPIVFAVGKECVFAQNAMRDTDSLLVDPDNPNELVNALLSVYSNQHQFNNESFFEKKCGKSRNSKLYAEIITSIEGE